MQVTTALAILVLSELCGAIRVPLDWEQGDHGESEVQPYQQEQPTEYNARYFAQPQQEIPKEYFVYTAKKPQFAIDIAKFHGVQNPEKHYQAYAIRPYTSKQRPELGKHKIFDENREAFQPFQQYAQQSQALTGTSSLAGTNYEVFHPYKAEEPELQEVYKDPVLDKIRDDIRNSQYRLQNYEKESGKPDISKDEYLESPQKTDQKKVPQRNIPTPYEIHRPQRQPLYYKIPPNFNSREQLLNHKFRLPWNQNSAKIKPEHYRPIRNNLQKLRQHHAIKFDDEHNEYPQLPPPQHYSDPMDGYDIYERGKEKYSRLRNNVDESINGLVNKHRPAADQKLELQSNSDRTQSDTNDDDGGDDDDSEFIPIKNYAQVRKTETMRHLPREAALADAEGIDEIINAPRLREAVKSTKAQTVYTEEGYEDAAYDHAGEQKHAEENEGHGGYLKEKEISGGKYKIPSFSGAYQDASGSKLKDQTLHGEKWKINDKDQEEQDDTDNYAEDETAQSVEADIYDDVNEGRDKRQNNLGYEDKNRSEENETKESVGHKHEYLNEKSNNNSRKESENIEKDTQHEVIKRETKFKVPEINLNTTFLNEGDIIKIAKLKEKIQPSRDEFKTKYPYYFQNLESVHKDSPLRYAENLKLIPRKTNGGTEFYDSRSNFKCPEVDDTVDAVPPKLKGNGHPDDEVNEDTESNGNKEKEQAEFDRMKEKPRLKGLGERIDCFKSKYFGENPLDSPFFKEDIISNPEPVTVPNLAAYKLKTKDVLTSESSLSDSINITSKLKEAVKSSALTLLDESKTAQLDLKDSLDKTNKDLRSLLSQNLAPISPSPQQINSYSEIQDQIKYIIKKPVLLGPSILSNSEIKHKTVNDDNSARQNNVTYNSQRNQEDVRLLHPLLRIKRDTSFVYEPYKIIRDGQVQESKKTTTTSNVSPLIRKLQSSHIVDRVSKSSQETEQPKFQHAVTRTYKDIGKREREKSVPKDNQQKSDPNIVDVNFDQRRGEPRYEIRPVNHKSQYSPVENKKAISLDDYQSKTNKIKIQRESTTQIPTKALPQQSETRKRHTMRQKSTTVKPFFDVTLFLPNSKNVQKSAASNTVTKILKAGDESNKENVSTSASEDSEEGDYEEYDDEEDTAPSTIATTTTTTLKPSFKRRTRGKITTSSPTNIEEQFGLPRLRLITRFRTEPSTEKSIPSEKPETHRLGEKERNRDIDSPKYREKKRKSTKTTVVTDTKSYNNGNDDADAEDEMRKDEIDSMIGIKQSMDEYKPNYEKEIEHKRKENDDEPSIYKNGGDEEYGDEEYEDENEDDSDEADDDEDEDEEDDEGEPLPEAVTTTAEPTKRTLIRTTEAPISTTEARSEKLQLKPIVTKKKIDIHKELPVNKSSPHRTQFKQDIEEVEIIKEMPKRTSQRKPQKNYEALQLYKDDKLAEEVNKLGDVEIFKQNLDLKKSPRHGGNYRSATKLTKSRDEKHHGGNYRKVSLAESNADASSTPQPLRGRNSKAVKEDAETSQSETTELVHLGNALLAKRKHGGNLKILEDFRKTRNRGRETTFGFSDSMQKSSPRNMHGGNLKSSSNGDRSHFGSKSEKLIEFDEESEDDDREPMHGGNFKSYENSRDDDSSFHGENLRNAKLIKSDMTNKENSDKTKEKTNIRSSSAVLLNSFAQAVSILTTTPAYILDPSKRMYYYVEA